MDSRHDSMPLANKYSSEDTKNNTICLPQLKMLPQLLFALFLLLLSVRRCYNDYNRLLPSEEGASVSHLLMLLASFSKAEDGENATAANENGDKHPTIPITLNPKPLNS